MVNVFQRKLRNFVFLDHMHSKNAFYSAIMTIVRKVLVSLEIHISYQTSMLLTISYAEFRIIHYVSSQNLYFYCFLVFAHFRNFGPLQCEQGYKSIHTIILVDISEFLTENNINRAFAPTPVF